MEKTSVAFFTAFLSLFLVNLMDFSSLSLVEVIHAVGDLFVVLVSTRIVKDLNLRNGGFTYGLHRAEVFSVIMNVGIVLIGSLVAVIVSLEEVESSPFSYQLPLILGSFLAAFSVILANGRYGIKEHAVMDSINYIVGAFAGIVILFTNWNVLDPIIAIVLVIFNIYISIPILRHSYSILMERSPIDMAKVEEQLRQIDPSVHHLHVWAVCDHINAATLHLKANPDDRFEDLEKRRLEIEKVLKKYNINHVTVQFEINETDKATS